MQINDKRITHVKRTGNAEPDEKQHNLGPGDVRPVLHDPPKRQHAQNGEDAVRQRHLAAGHLERELAQVLLAALAQLDVAEPGVAAEVPVDEVALGERGGEGAAAERQEAQADFEGVVAVGLEEHGWEGGGDDHLAGYDEGVVEEEQPAFFVDEDAQHGEGVGHFLGLCGGHSSGGFLFGGGGGAFPLLDVAQE